MLHFIQYFQPPKSGEATAVVYLMSSLVRGHFSIEGTISDLQSTAITDVKGTFSIPPGSLPALFSPTFLSCNLSACR